MPVTILWKSVVHHKALTLPKFANLLDLLQMEMHRPQSSNEGITDNGVFVGLSTRPNSSEICLPLQFYGYLNHNVLFIGSPPAEIMVRVVQFLERIAEQQRVQDARLIALDRRLDNLQQFQQQYSTYILIVLFKKLISRLIFKLYF